MKIISWNVNGIRAVDKKGELENLLKTCDPGVLLIQETKAQEDKLGPIIKKYDIYEQFYNAAERPGYAGTGIWIKKSLHYNISFSTEFPGYKDTEGRVARIDLDDWTIFSIYFPNGGKSDEAWQEKLVFYEKFLFYVNKLRQEGRKVIWAGDVNCAHEEIDLARPKDNENSIGFLPEERAWVTKVIKNNWMDIFRYLYPKKIIYSWWHVITRARDRNIGWRIDYFFLEEGLMKTVKDIKYLNGQMGSDHCPVELEISI
ncbi:exodeoxyribonuclease III [Candidatus Gracilibacteria bacterium]|nr:exodeoxyribonuclease III [Candidatus Gracilibacteria bacterium]